MAPPEVEEARAKLLDAAVRCWQRGGLDAMGMAEIASEAGVARSTVYRYFPNRDELMLGLARREVQAVRDDMEPQLAELRDPADRIVEGFVLALRMLPRRRLLVELLPRLEVWTSRTMVELGQEFLVEAIAPARARGRLRTDLREERLVEWIYRVLISLLTLPARWVRDEDELRETLRHLLVPVLLAPDGPGGPGGGG
jgi:AcrR family transcriptional regulator